MGDMGDMGNMGGLSINGIQGSTVIIPNRGDFPLNTEPAQTWDPVGGWTPVAGNSTIGELPNLAPKQFPDASWSANWRAWLMLGVFTKEPTWTAINLTLWNSANQDDEIKLLLRAATDERADALGEIVAQNDSYEDIMAYFVSMLGITPRTHPATFHLLHIAGLVGLMTAMYFKANPGGGRKPRPRPTMVCPALLAAVTVPDHPSFPSGHATQSMLMAVAVLDALKAHAALQTAWKPRLQTLAWRIARNREIAGLHFASDSFAGAELASKSYDILKNVTGYDALRAKAETELTA